MDKERLRQLLSVIRISANKIEEMIERDDSFDHSPPTAAQNEIDSIASRLPNERLEHKPFRKEVGGMIIEEMPIFSLSSIAENEKWPEAVPSWAISEDTEAGFKKRASGILNSADLNIIKGNFLDYGCGDGYVAAEAKNRGASFSMGYDIVSHPSWTKLAGQNLIFTELPPLDDLPLPQFDIILLYDVLDHAKNVFEIMKDVKQFLKKDGTAYVRCHPYTSKHATHTYKQVNKAYVHLFATEQELKNKGATFSQPLLDPLTTYNKWFSDFEIVSEKVVREDMPSYFQRNEMKQQLSLVGFNSQNIGNLSIQFVDYKLKHKG